MQELIIKAQKLSVPSTFTAIRFQNTPIKDNSCNFVYGMQRSAKSTIAYIKGNLNSLLAIVIENSGEVISPLDAIALLKLPENKDKAFDVNALSFENSCFNAIAFLRF
jgi:hypothetical protein